MTEVGIGQPVWTADSRGIVFTEVNDQLAQLPRPLPPARRRPSRRTVTLYEETENIAFSVGVGRIAGPTA